MFGLYHKIFQRQFLIFCSKTIYLKKLKKLYQFSLKIGIIYFWHFSFDLFKKTRHGFSQLAIPYHRFVVLKCISLNLNLYIIKILASYQRLTNKKSILSENILFQKILFRSSERYRWYWQVFSFIHMLFL